MKSISRVLAVIVVTIMCSNISLGEDCTFTPDNPNCTGLHWDDVDCWSCGHIPYIDKIIVPAGKECFFGGSSCEQVGSGPIYATTIEIQTGATLTFQDLLLAGDWESPSTEAVSTVDGTLKFDVDSDEPVLHVISKHRFVGDGFIDAKTVSVQCGHKGDINICPEFPVTFDECLTIQGGFEVGTAQAGQCQFTEDFEASREVTINGLVVIEDDFYENRFVDTTVLGDAAYCISGGTLELDGGSLCTTGPLTWNGGSISVSANQTAKFSASSCP